MTQQKNSRVFYAQGWNADYQLAEHGEGIFVFDGQGKRYLDAIGGTHCITLGYGVEEIAQAMAAQAMKVPFTHKVQFTNTPQEELATAVVEIAPAGMNHVLFVTGGSTANEMAMQIARYYHLVRSNENKYRVIGRWHSYHGRTTSTLSMSGSLFVKREDMQPYQYDFPHIHAPHCYQCPFSRSYPECQLACATALADTIEREGAQTIAAFIAEPIIGGAGSAIVPPPGYYEKIREICDAYDVLFIAEEVVTGFGRTGKNFGIQHWDVVPDFLTSAKGLSSGYAPMGCVILHEKITETFFHSQRQAVPTFVTYSGHPISCAAALAVQKYVKKHDLVQQCAARGEYLKKALQQLAEGETLIGDVRGKGLLLGVEFVQDRATHEPMPRHLHFTETLIKNAFANGLMTRGRFGTGTQINGDHILLSPPFIISEAECDELVGLLAQSIIQARAQCGV